MVKRYKNADVYGLIVCLVTLVAFICWQISIGFFMINEVLGFVLLSGSIIFKIVGIKRAQYLIFFLLIILLFQVVNFSVAIEFGNTSTTQDSGSFISIGFNPIIFLLLIGFFVINWSFMVYFFGSLFYGSEKENQEKVAKDCLFYYEKFNGYSVDELYKVLKMYDEYPEEAKMALNKIKEERNLAIDI